MPITDQACPGPCNAQARAAWASYDDAAALHAAEMQLHTDGPRPEPPQPPSVPVTPGQPVWCPRCARLLRAALQELDDIAAMLAAGVDGHREAALAGPNGTKPMQHTAIIETLDELLGWLFQAEDEWRRYRGYAPRPHRARGAHARAMSVGWLAEHWGDLLLDRWSETVGLEVLRWQRRLRALAKADPTSRRSPIECPRCRERQVQRRDDYWECASCGRLMNETEHNDEYARQAAELAQQEVTA